MSVTDVERWDREHLYRFRAYPWRSIDGDTFVALPSCGFDMAAFPHIRLLGVFAPEMSDPDGPAARERLWSALHAYPEVASWPLRIESTLRVRVVEDTKSFDRYVARVWVVTPSGRMQPIEELIA